MHGDHLIRSMSSVRWGPSAVRQQPAGFSRAVVSEDGDVGEDDDSDGDFASGTANTLEAKTLGANTLGWM